MFIEAVFTDRIRVQNAHGMCMKRGTFLGHASGNENNRYYVVDGKVWLIKSDMLGILLQAVRLGDYFDYCAEIRRGIRSVCKPS